MPDHATPQKLKTHSSEAVPFALMTNVDLAISVHHSDVIPRPTEAGPVSGSIRDLR